jgi:multidrug efflux pump subunit AcrB
VQERAVAGDGSQLNQGLPAPIDVQLSGSNVEATFQAASDMASAIRKLSGVSDVYIPQDVDYPSLRLDIDRERAGELGLDQREVVNNVITALTSNQMIAPSYWVDPKSGNDYMLTVQYPENQIRNLVDLRGIPLHSGRLKDPTLLDAVTRITPLKSPTEIDHYQIQRVIDISVPLTNGNLFSARSSEASFHALVEEQRLRDLENRVARDVRVALLEPQTGFQRLDVTNQILDQASQALDLADARYSLGLSSIVELTQAQLNKTRAEIEQASARYDYQALVTALRYQMGTLR